MNISKFTQKSVQAVQDLEKVAYEYGNQEVEQEHLLYALLTQEDSLILKLIEKMEINKDYFINTVKKALDAKVKVSGGDLRFGQYLNKSLVNAENEAKAMGDEYVSVEHLFSVIKDGRIKIDFESESFLGFYELKGINKPKENVVSRTRGTVTVRNSGVGVGKLYIYRENRVLSPNHTNVGKIIKGMEIVDIAKKGDFITIKSNQDRLMLLGHNQNEIDEKLASLNIEHIKEGVTGEDALIVEQTPKYTIDILNEGKVTTKSIHKDDLCEINFTDNAPRTVKYFKLVSGLLEEPIGKIKVHFSVPGMHILIFEGDSNTSKGLVPENTPENIVKACEIGITNMAAKNVGLIGVRFEDNKEFGPTAESFNSTNILGKVVSDYSKLEKFKDGEIVYVKESND